MVGGINEKTQRFRVIEQRGGLDKLSDGTVQDFSAKTSRRLYRILLASGNNPCMDDEINRRTE